MTEPPLLLPEAQKDVADAFLWYEHQKMGLGMEFLRCVETALLAIQRTPLTYPIAIESYRRLLVRHFPFAIFFEFETALNRYVVYSVFHCSQDPEKWKTRLPT